MEPTLPYDEQGSRQRVAVSKRLSVNVTGNTQAEMCTEDHSYYRSQYKKLITDVAEALQTEDCKRLAYQQDINGSPPPLDLLKQLERNGKIGYSKISELSVMLTNINRSDVISSKIEPFVRKYKARHTSLPEGASNPRLNPGRRVNTFSGLGSTEILNETGNGPNVPQQETLPETFAQPVLQDVTGKSVRNTDSEVDQRNQTINSMELFEHPVLTSTPTGVASLNHGPPNSSSSHMRQRSRHVSEILRGGNTSSPFPVGNGRSDSFPASNSAYELVRHPSKPPSTSTSHEPLPPSVTSLSDWSSTAGEMLQYNENAQRMGMDSTMVHTHTEGTHDRGQFTQTAATPLFAVGPPANSESMSIPPSPSFPPENQVSYDHRFDSIGGRERRANSVIPSEYVLINEQLHKVRTFQVSSDQDYRRSFTPPASIPLAREASLIEPTPARPRVTSPLSEYNRFTPKPSHTNGMNQSIERSLDLTSPITHDQAQPLSKQPLLASVGLSTTQEPEVKHGWPIHKPISDVHQSGVQKGTESSAFSRLGTGLTRKDSNDTLTNSVSPPMQSPTPPSKGARGLDDTIRESDSESVNTALQSVVPSKVPKRPSSGLKISRLKRPLIGTRSKRLVRDLSWSVKRNKLNKAIYEHKENKTIECTKKLELDVGHGSSLNPKLSVILHPYGLEGDKRRYVTLEVHIDVSKKAPKLSSAAKVRFSVSATDNDEKQQLKDVTVDKDVLLREFYIHEFISHEALRESRSETIAIKAYVEYLPAVPLET